jgi:gamma-tubulin complex component 2
MSEEYKLRKIFEELISETNSDKTPDECLRYLRGELRSPSNWRNCSVSQTVESLAAFSNDPNKFRAILEYLYTTKIPILCPYVLLLQYLKSVNPVDNQLIPFNDGDLSDVAESIDDSPSDLSIFQSKLGSLVNRIKISRSQFSGIRYGDQCSNTFPEVTKWKNIRPMMGMDFIQGEAPCEPIFAWNQGAMEKQLVQDLLACFTGLQGTYITSDPIKSPHDIRTFTISDEVDSKFRTLVERMLPLGSYYSTLIRFIEDNMEIGVGRVNQALAANLRNHLKEFTFLVTDLEVFNNNGMLDLNLLLSETRNSIEFLHSLSDLVRSIVLSSARDGRTLTILHDYATSYITSNQLRLAVLLLVKDASAPYFESISRWIYCGILYDPYDEFMVTLNPKYEDQKNNDDHKKYALRLQKIPNFLQPAAEMIYDAGRYMNILNLTEPFVIREKFCPDEFLVYDTNANYLRAIERAYKYANDTLLNIVMKDYDVMGWLTQVSSIFFMEKGNFCLNLIHACDVELRRPVDDICLPYLSTLFDSAIESTYDNKKFASKLKVALKKERLVDQMNKLTWRDVRRGERDLDERLVVAGYEAFTLAVDVDWPITLVIDERAQACYQALFRHLFYSKYVLRRLVEKKLRPRAARKVATLRYRMVSFVQALHYYTTDDVLRSRWFWFEKVVSQVESIESLHKAHAHFLYRCIADSLLFNYPLLACYQAILDLCLEFTLLPDNNELAVTRYEEVFSARIASFFSQLKNLRSVIHGDCYSFINIRTNFNGYYDLSDNLCLSVY